MLNRLASLTMSTSVLKALPGKLDTKSHSPSILYLYGHFKEALTQDSTYPYKLHLDSQDSSLIYSSVQSFDTFWLQTMNSFSRDKAQQYNKRV